VTLWQRLIEGLEIDPCAELDKLDRHRIIRALIGWGVTDAVHTVDQRIRDEGIDSEEKLRARGEPVIGFSAPSEAQLGELKVFLYEHLYRHWRVVRMAAKAERVLRALFEAYLIEPAQLPDTVQSRIAASDDAMERLVCDYVAGMTDRFALDEYARLFDPSVRV
jgi:dGTPase